MGAFPCAVSSRWIIPSPRNAVFLHRRMLLTPATTLRPPADAHDGPAGYAALRVQQRMPRNECNMALDGGVTARGCGTQAHSAASKASTQLASFRNKVNPLLRIGPSRCDAPQNLPTQVGESLTARTCKITSVPPCLPRGRRLCARGGLLRERCGVASRSLKRLRISRLV